MQRLHRLPSRLVQVPRTSPGLSFWRGLASTTSSKPGNASETTSQGSGYYRSKPEEEKVDEEAKRAVDQRLEQEATDFAQSKEQSEKNLGRSMDPSPS